MRPRSQTATSEAKRVSLLDAHLFDFFLISHAPEVSELVTHLLELLQQKGTIIRTRDADRYKRTLTAIVLNLYVANAIRPGGYRSIPMRPDAYSTRRRYMGSYASFGIFSRFVQALVELGLVESKVGFKDRRTGKGFRTRIRATAPLLQLLTSYGIRRQMIARSPDFEVIRLKSKNKTLRDYHDTPETIAMRTRLERINAAIDSAFIALNVTDALLMKLRERRYVDEDGYDVDATETKGIDFTQRRLYRIFNDDSFELGGRFYGGWWQSVPSHFRKHIYVATLCSLTPSSIVEVDFSSMQPSLAYGLVGAKPPTSAYKLAQHTAEEQKQFKPLLKAAMLRMLNTKSRIKAIKSLELHYKREEVSDAMPSPAQVVDWLETEHAPICDLFYGDAGKKLMYAESVIAEQVMLEMLDHGTVVLPVHDSFLVNKGFRKELVASMHRAFRQHTGFDGSVTEDETEGEYFVRKMHEDHESGRTEAQAIKRQLEIDKLAGRIRRHLAGGGEFPDIARLRELVDYTSNNPVAGMSQGDLRAFKKREKNSRRFWDEFMNWAFARP